MQDTIFYWKSWKGFLPVRDCSQFPQKLESRRKGSPTADTRTSLRLQSVPAGFQETINYQELASTAHSELHRRIAKVSLALPHLSSAPSLNQNIRKLHIPSDAGKFSATTKDSNAVVLVMTMDAITYYVAYFPILSSNYFDNIYKWVHAIHWKFLIFLF